MPIPDSIKPVKRVSLREQIYSSIRKSILCGELQHGEKLPPTMELVKRWGTQAANIQAALAPLVKEGLLIREKGLGTIVNSAVTKLERIALYCNYDLYSQDAILANLLIPELKRKLKARNIEGVIINYDESAFDLLSYLINQKNVQAVIAPFVDRSNRPKLEKLPVPFACLTSARIQRRICVNRTQGVNILIQGLKKLGTKRFGAFFSSPVNGQSTESGDVERASLRRLLIKELKAAQIETRDEWLVDPPEEWQVAVKSQQQFAYDTFESFWQLPDKPDTLFIEADNMLTGVLMGIMANRVDVPGDLKLLARRNAGDRQYSPLPCLFVETDPAEMADGLIQLIEDQFNGQPPRQIELSNKLVNHLM